MTELHKQISALADSTLNQGVCFVTVLAKRMSPSYKAFSDQTGFGNPNRLYEMIQIGEKSVAAPFEYDDDTWHALRTELLDLAPDTEDHPTAAANYALDACAACDSVLALLSEEDSNALYRSAQLCFDSLSIFLQEQGILSDSAILEHPTMKNETSFLINLIQQILVAPESELWDIISKTYPPLLP